jgi:hypothetical protein
MSESWKVASEIRQRTGHRFNIIIKNLPENSDSAITFDELLRRVEVNAYLGGEIELTENLDALEKRREIGVIVDPNGTRRYWATGRGRMENRKRIALIKLHTAELTEAEIATLEKMAQTKRHPLTGQEC